MIRQLLATTLGLAVALLAGPTSANPISHWTFDKPTPNTSPWANSVAGEPNMVHDASTVNPAGFDSTQVRLETFPDPNTRLFTTGASVGETFSFSLIIDPTDLFNFGPILAKQSDEAGGGDFARVGWALQPVPGGLEFIVRGSDFGAGDFFGVTSVSNGVSGLPIGGNFGDDSRWQLAGGYDAVSGNAYLYVTPIDAGPVTSLLGGTALFTPGATQDTTPISLGSFVRTSNAGGPEYVQGSGFDADDLQFYDRLLSPTQLLFLANNPGLSVPEPTTAGLVILALLGLAGTRHRD